MSVGYLFIGDELTISANVQLPCEIIEGYFLKRASEEEIEGIRIKMGIEHESFRQIHYENKREEDKLVPLSKSEYKYWIIEFEGVTFERADSNLELALALSEININLLFESLPGSMGGKISKQYKINNFVTDNIIYLKQKELKTKDIEEVRKIYRLLKCFSRSQRTEINKALDDFIGLCAIPSNSPFYIVSMLSIIEGLISHNPDNNGPSISHQLTTKLALLNNRFEKKLEDTYNLGSNFDKFIKKIYSYRSKVAHGSVADFATSELKSLISKEEATRRIYTFLQRIIVQSLIEPQLIDDLRIC